MKRILSALAFVVLVPPWIFLCAFVTGSLYEEFSSFFRTGRFGFFGPMPSIIGSLIVWLPFVVILFLKSDTQGGMPPFGLGMLKDWRVKAAFVVAVAFCTAIGLSLDLI